MIKYCQQLIYVDVTQMSRYDVIINSDFRILRKYPQAKPEMQN